MPREEYVQEFLVVGRIVRTHNEIEVQKEKLNVPKSAKIPMLWEQFITEVGLQHASVPSGWPDNICSLFQLRVRHFCAL
jgi:hypothetical protein